MGAFNALPSLIHHILPIIIEHMTKNFPKMSLVRVFSMFGDSMSRCFFSHFFFFISQLSFMASKWKKNYLAYYILLSRFPSIPKVMVFFSHFCTLNSFRMQPECVAQSTATPSLIHSPTITKLWINFWHIFDPVVDSTTETNFIDETFFAANITWNMHSM